MALRAQAGAFVTSSSIDPYSFERRESNDPSGSNVPCFCSQQLQEPDQIRYFNGTTWQGSSGLHNVIGDPAVAVIRCGYHIRSPNSVVPECDSSTASNNVAGFTYTIWFARPRPVDITSQPTTNTAFGPGTVTFKVASGPCYSNTICHSLYVGPANHHPPFTNFRAIASQGNANTYSSVMYGYEVSQSPGVPFNQIRERHPLRLPRTFLFSPVDFAYSFK